MAAGLLAYTSTQLSESSMRSDIESDLKGLLQADPTAISHIIDLNMVLFKRMAEIESSYKLAINDIHACEERIGSLTREMDHLRLENSLLTHKLAEVDDSTRQLNLRVEGLLESNNENLKESVAGCLSRSGITCTTTDIDYAKRMGRYREGQVRPILVRLVREGLRNAILYNRANISRASNPPVWINDDVSEVTRKHRKRTRDVAYLAKLNGVNNVKIHSDGIIVGDEKYHHTDLDLLPPNLSTQKATTRIDEEDIFFQGDESPFSNFYPCTIVDDGGRIFFSAEQLFQYRRAKAHGKLSVANKMMKTRNNSELKRLEKKVQPSTEWRKEEENVMADILMLKFTQNKGLGRALINTGHRQLHEATGNRKWGVGFDISSKGLTEREWMGGDLLGQLLENTREAIRAVYDHPPPQTMSSPNDYLSVHERSDYLITPLPQDDEEDEPSDYEECLQPDLIGGEGIHTEVENTPSSRPSQPSQLSQSQHTTTPKILDSTTGSSSEVSQTTLYSQPVTGETRERVASLRNPRNPYKSTSPVSAEKQFASPKSTQHLLHHADQQSDLLDQQFDISGQHFSPRGPGLQFAPRGPAKRSTRRVNRPRSQAK